MIPRSGTFLRNPLCFPGNSSQLYRNFFNAFWEFPCFFHAFWEISPSFAAFPRPRTLLEIPHGFLRIPSPGTSLGPSFLQLSRNIPSRNSLFSRKLSHRFLGLPASGSVLGFRLGFLRGSQLFLGYLVFYFLLISLTGTFVGVSWCFLGVAGSVTVPGISPVPIREFRVWNLCGGLAGCRPTTWLL